MRTSSSTVEINAPADRVWDALINPSKVKLWQYGSEVVTSWEPGTPIRFITPWGEKVFEQWGTLIEFVPNKILKYSLFAPRPGLSDSQENYFYMTYLLDEGHEGTKLSVIQDDPRPQIPSAQDHEDDGENAILKGLKELVELG
ncbi:MAG TPA: SRPBCC domain-containing protein [Stenotrophomonas sp.]